MSLCEIDEFTTLEQINEIEDKVLRLELLNDFVRDRLQNQRDAAELIADEEMNASRDDAHGMMSRFGKPKN